MYTVGAKHRILLVQPYASAVGGVDSVLLQLIRAARAVAPSFEFVVVIPPGSPYVGRYLEHNTQVVEIDLSVFTKTLSLRPIARALILMPNSLFQLGSTIRQFRISLVHSHKINVLVGDIAAKIMGVPAVHTYHEINTGGLWLYRVLSLLVASLTERIVLVCDASGELLGPSWKRNPRVTRIYNGIEPVVHLHRQADANSLRNQLGLPPAVPIVGAVSRIQDTKGIEYFIEAADHVRRKRPDVHFLMVGDVISDDRRFRDYKQACFDQVERLGLEAHFHFTGIRRDVIDIYGLLDVFVLPSIFDVFPTTVLEAMAMGLPIVATRVGGVPEQIVDGKTGLLVPPRDAQALANGILALLSDQEKARAMGAAGRLRVTTEFTAERYVQQTLSLYCDVLGIPPAELVSIPAPFVGSLGS